MALVNLQNIDFNFSKEQIFSGLSLRVNKGEKIGLVGPNGSGKTTLLKLLTETLEPDRGEINRRNNVKIAYLPQEPLFDGDKTIMEELHRSADEILAMQRKLEALSEKMSDCQGKELEAVMQQFDRLSHEFELAGGYSYETRIKEITGGLGLKEEHHKLKTSQLSGGQLSRLGLAQVLLTDADLLLLDEPTNHLDWNSILWLENYLKRSDAAALIVSHDRYLLDSVAERIADINNAKIDMYKGNYSTYKEQSEIKKLQQEREAEKMGEFIARQQKFIEMNRNQKGMQKIARGRQKQLNRVIEGLPDEEVVRKKDKRLRFSFSNIDVKSTRLDAVVECCKLGKRFDEICLFEGLDLELLTGQKLGIIGPNGTGKSTFLKMVLGREDGSGGVLKVKKGLDVGYLDQSGQELDSEKTVLEELRATVPEYTPEQARNHLGAFLFSGDDAFKKVGDLSGGEKNRLALAKLVLIEPDILVLDEPTNHLDMDSIDALEGALADYPGTVLLVSHDRYFINKLADRLLAIGVDEAGRKKMGSHQVFDGKLAKYFRQVEEKRAQAADKKDKGNRQGKARAHKPKNAAPPELKQFNTWQAERIEEQIEITETAIAELKEKFSDEDIYTCNFKIAELQQQVDEKEAWLELLYRAYERKIG